jgi:DNA-directed RNA polymerase subunit M/transcription elongation factor TFIIS
MWWFVRKSQVKELVSAALATERAERIRVEDIRKAEKEEAAQRATEQLKAWEKLDKYDPARVCCACGGKSTLELTQGAYGAKLYLVRKCEVCGHKWREQPLEVCETSAAKTAASAYYGPQTHFIDALRYYQAPPMYPRQGIAGLLGRY